MVLYPLRLSMRFAFDRPSDRPFQISIPASFDPAPLLYPPTLTIFVTLLLSVSNHNILLPAIILSVSSLPIELVPNFFDFESSCTLHWFLSCIPLFLSERSSVSNLSSTEKLASGLDREALVLLYPLHRALCITLHYLTTTSLLRAELQLLSIALISLLMLSSSPQAVILKALLWGGGIGTFITCSKVLKWGLTLARVPRWRFRRATKRGTSISKPSFKGDGNFPLLRYLKAFLNIGKETFVDTSDEDESPNTKSLKPFDLKVNIRVLNGIPNRYDRDSGSISAIEKKPEDRLPVGNTTPIQDLIPKMSRKRRHTLPDVGQPMLRSSKRTPSGRKKRSASSSLRSFFSLTEKQATMRKWLYAGYVYICMALIILLGIRPYVGEYALNGNEPIGWALGYFFGNLPWFRMEVITANLERWICLPGRDSKLASDSCHSGWVEHLRHSTFGSANVRLILCAYWLAIIITGLAIVFRLSAIYEVDTRRKVFHFMMVGMLLPATYVDPAFAALALGLMLAIFLILDLFRASQLPPLSKPLAYFLTPYVDGRDLRGPVVISHIFLLIGSAIPLWLSLGALPRVGTGPWSGWEVPTRDVSMVSGVVCVGMGDAAASLIGRRYGRHKWFWSGGKSIEGSLAFATAVTMALLAAKAWLRFGGWPTGGNEDVWLTTVWKTGVAASLASLTEAVLTGGNDNVVVPVVLWLCVKGLGI
jgi:dolichol kinase